MRRALVLSLVLAACGGDTDTSTGAPAPVSDTEEFAQTWMHFVAQDPGRLANYEQGGVGDAWLGFFHNDLSAAASKFASSCTPSEAPWAARAAAGAPCVGLARTHLELAEFYGTVAEIDRVATRQFVKHRRANPDTVLASVHEGFFYGLALTLSGDPAGATELSTYAARADADPFLAALAARVGDGSDALAARIWGAGAGDAAGDGFDGLPESSGTANYRKRLAFMAAVAAGDAEGAGALIRPIRASDADLLEELDGGTDSVLKPAIHHHDPAFLRSMSRFHALQAAAAVPGVDVLQAQAGRLLGRPSPALGDAPSVEDGLSLVLFGSVPSPVDLYAAETGYPAHAAALSRFSGASPVLAAPPSPNLADLDVFVEVSNGLTMALSAALRGSGPAGANLDADMGLAERFRGQLLKERAMQYQQAYDVRLDADDGADLASAGVAAQSLLELALDKNPSPPNSRLKAARISFRNDPTLLATLAHAQLDTRHPYDSNEYIRPLTEVYPELISVREALAALDSAWNPARKGSVR